MKEEFDGFEGVLLRVVDYRENDCIVSYLGVGVGKGSAFAHNARGSRKRFPGGLELFRWYRFGLKRSQRTSGALPQLTLAEPVVDLHHMSASLERIAVASCALEVVRELVREGEPHDAVLSRLWAFLRAIHDDLAPDDTPRLLLALRWFEIQVLTEQGVAPELAVCLRSGRPIDECSEGIVFSLAAGGVLSKSAAEEADQAVPVEAGLLRGLLRLQQTPLGEVLEGARQRAAAREDNDAKLRLFTRDAGRITRMLLTHLVEAPSKAYPFLARIVG